MIPFLFFIQDYSSYSIFYSSYFRVFYRIKQVSRLIFFFCLCMHLYEHVHAGVGRGQRSALDAFSSTLFVLYTVFHWTWSSSAGWTGWPARPPGTSRLHSTTAGIIGFLWVPRIWIHDHTYTVSTDPPSHFLSLGLIFIFLGKMLLSFSLLHWTHRFFCVV